MKQKKRRKNPKSIFLLYTISSISTKKMRKVNDNSSNNNQANRRTTSYYRILEEKSSSEPSLHGPRFLKFSYFRLLKEFPKYPQTSLNYTIPLSAINEELREKSLFLFISHMWLRASTSSLSAAHHPDNERNDVFKLCVKGIDSILKTMTKNKELLECYIWIDYSCLDCSLIPISSSSISADHRSEKENDIFQLEKVIEICDAIFTPVYDPNHEDWNYSFSSSCSLLRYPSSSFFSSSLQEQRVYCNRAWCRLEMFLASNIPVKQHLIKNKLKNNIFTGELVYYLKQGQRPHLLFGSKEYNDFADVLTLPPLNNDFLEQYNPLEGFCSLDDDCDYLGIFYDKLQEHIEKNSKKPTVEAEAKYEGNTSLYSEKQQQMFVEEDRKDDYMDSDKDDSYFHQYFDSSLRYNKNKPRSRSSSVDSDELLFDKDRKEDREINESMFGRGFYAGRSFDEMDD
jgi:hypothetical protein